MDRLCTCSDHLDAILSEDTCFFKLDREVERCLASKSWQHCIRAFLGDDAREALYVEWLDVGRIRKLGVGHNRRGVRVN